MSSRIFNALFLCTGNSARSILAESVLNHAGAGRFRAYSAGSHPAGAVHPQALSLLEQTGFPTANLRSKAWDEFEGLDAPVMDFVFTVCDRAAGEVCPVWPGHPVTAHWGMEDPAAVTGSDEDRRKAFSVALHHLRTRIGLLLALPIEKLDRLALTARVQEIGVQSPPDASR